jgi:RNA-binding protein
MKRPKRLTTGQRKQLRGLAHHLEPLVQVGHKGITDELLDAVDVALTDHELVKVRISANAPVDRKTAGATLADRTDAHDVGVVGRVVILYRRHPETPRVPLRS